MSMVSKDECKEFLNIDTGTTSYDDFLDNLITRAEKIVSTYCNRTFDQTTRNELYSGDGTDRLMLDHFPIISVSAYSESYDVYAQTTSDTLTPSTEFVINYKNGILGKQSNTFSEGQHNIKITYVSGYESGKEPDDVKQVVIELVSKKFKDREEGRFGITTRNVMNENATYSYEDLNKMHRDILDKYRAIPRGNAFEVTE